MPGGADALVRARPPGRASFRHGEFGVSSGVRVLRDVGILRGLIRSIAGLGVFTSAAVIYLGVFGDFIGDRNRILYLLATVSSRNPRHSIPDSPAEIRANCWRIGIWIGPWLGLFVCVRVLMGDIRFLDR